jgi:hypothetical protein
MVRAKNSSKGNSRKRAAPVLGFAGMSLAVASGASASTAGSEVDVRVQNTATDHELFLGEEGLSTFYVFDKENDALRRVGEKVAGAAAVAADSMAAGAVGEAAGAVAAAVAARW